ncbi:MAG: glycosyltransferase family 2 protein [Candidatus Brocadiae bacterium]|nr:glycosyltransferase family 2 protein [Candidatus Brocadiia bacterium]
MKLTALIPAHNDDYTLGFCLRSIADHFDEIVVLDDCSSDHTADVALDAAARHRHVRLIRYEGAQQLGWVRARNRLLEATDSDHLFWLDADDVLCEYAAHRLREIAKGPRPLVRLELCEMWGDFDHTTQRLRHYDRCHVYWNRRLLKDVAWRGGSTAKYQLDGKLKPARSGGPLLFHVKGVKPDRRLVERQYVRKWLRAGAPGRLEDFAGLAEMDEDDIHRRAVNMLLRSRQDKLRRWVQGAPERPTALRHRPQRFEIVYRDGKPVDRVDHEEDRSDV